MIEIGLLFHSSKIENDIERSIRRFEERMCAEPNTIYIDSDLEIFAGMKVKSASLPKFHFVLAREDE